MIGIEILTCITLGIIGVVLLVLANLYKKTKTDLRNAHTLISDLKISESTATTLAEERQETLTKNTAVIEGLNARIIELSEDKAKLQGTLESKEKIINEINERHLQDLKNTKETLTKDFELLSNKLFKMNSEDFALKSKTSLEGLILPLREKIEAFQKSALEIQRNSTLELVALKTNIKSIIDTSTNLGNETHRLTRILKGDVQKRGAWGELVLETVLKSSGLRKDHEYTIHGEGLELENLEGNRQHPDVVINLPDNKHLIIDSKFSHHYEDCFTAETEELRINSLEKLINSIRFHIKGLSGKKYSFANGLNTPDMTLMFIPIEAMFSLVVEADRDLFEDAWKKGIVIVSPANLLAILRTIESIWKVERQNKNSLEIAKEGGLLYDKFVGLLDSLGKLHGALADAQKYHVQAMDRLQNGSGNVIRKIERLKELGVKAQKKIPEHLLDNEIDAELVTNIDFVEEGV